jgi:LPS-assembly lipoprotein
MSSGDARAQRRVWALLVLLGACLPGATLLGACGFQPMYGEARGVETRADLQTVRVTLIANRTGQLLHRYILDRIHSGDRTPPALYQLEVAIIENRQYYGIQRDLTATYARLVLTGTYTLRDLKTQQGVLTGSVNAYSSYNVAADPFNTVVAENDARERAVHSLGDDLINRVSFYLRNPPAQAPSS